METFPLSGFLFTLVLSSTCTQINETLSTDAMPTMDTLIYHTVTIGTQKWMVENLSVTKYRNGDPIINVEEAGKWGNLNKGAWSYYNNDSEYNNPYGKLYNSYAVTDSRKICPKGWHIPSDNEWTILEKYLGDSPGSELKEAGTAHWLKPYTGNKPATNSTGFTALPGGYRDAKGNFPFNGIENLGALGLYWSTTEFDKNNLWIRTFNYNFNGITRQEGAKKSGISCRCIMD